ncbi:MAG: sensor histidine kinase [bacterium]
MHYNVKRYKYIFIYASLLALILSVYNGIVYFSVRLVLIRDMDEKLEIKAREIADILPVDKIKEESVAVFEGALAGQKGNYIRLVDVNGRLIFKNSTMPHALSSLLDRTFSPSPHEINFLTLKTRSAFFRVINYPLIENDRTRFILQIALPATTYFIPLKKLNYILWVTMIIIIAITVFLMILFLLGLLKPILYLENFTEHISQKDLKKRIPHIKGAKEVQGMVQSFNVMMERLDKSFTNMSDFTSYIAHELKIPLAIIRGELELGLIQNKFNDPQQEIVASCVEEIDRMTTIINDLHYLAKIDYLPDLLTFERINLKKYLTEIYTHSILLASGEEIEVALNSCDECLLINADKTHLRRLFFNIINNAIKFTAPKGKISISTRNDQSKVYISISDTGRGIAQEDLPKIFDKSYQADKSKETKERGSGLGLTIAIAIAKAHQGDITVKSIFKEGTTFTVILPLAEPT